MSTAGGSPTTTGNDTTVGTQPWTRADYDLAELDVVEASISIHSGEQSYYLLGGTIAGVGAIPGDATIDGVEVQIYRRVSDAAGGAYPSIRDASVRIWDGLAWIGGDKADTGADWTTSLTYSTHGGPTDDWGLSSATWLAMLAGLSWGVGVSVAASGGVSPSTAYVDAVVVTVYYTVYVDTGEEAIYVCRFRLDVVEDDERGSSRYSFDPYPIPEPTVDDFYQAVASRSSRVLDDEDESSSRMSYVSAAEFVAPTTESVFVFAGSSPRMQEDDEVSRSAWSMPSLVIADGVICDCAGVALVTASGYGTARVRGSDNADDPTQRFGVAQITASGHGRAAITISCQC